MQRTSRRRSQILFVAVAAIVCAALSPRSHAEDADPHSRNILKQMCDDDGGEWMENESTYACEWKDDNVGAYCTYDSQAKDSCDWVVLDDPDARQPGSPLDIFGWALGGPSYRLTRLQNEHDRRTSPTGGGSQVMCGTGSAAPLAAGAVSWLCLRGPHIRRRRRIVGA